MRHRILILLILFAAIMGGCARQGAKSRSQDMPKTIYDQIQIGMTTDQLKALAGEPGAKGNPMPQGTPSSKMASNMPPVENWVYGKVVIMVSNGKVMNKMGY